MNRKLKIQNMGCKLFGSVTAIGVSITAICLTFHEVADDLCKGWCPVVLSRTGLSV